MSLRQPATLEIRGIAGSLRVYDAAGSYYLIGGITRAGTTSSTVWPLLYSLTPGEYVLGPTASGTQTLNFHGVAGPVPQNLTTSFSAGSVVDNGIFLWNGTTHIAAEKSY
jgi:hypothetical protein